MVKVSLSILLSALVLLQGLNLHLKDLFELSDLIEHLEMHQSSYGDDLYSFLDKHYGVKRSEHDLQGHRDGGDHDRLPFKDKASCSTISHLVILPGIDSRKVVCDAMPEVPYFHYQENYSFLNQTDIFQPPRTI
jgi:hypothetical protein